MAALNYNKWDKLDLHDDEDVSDCHPNIDGKLWLRLKREKKEKEWYEEDVRTGELVEQQAGREAKLAELKAKLAAGCDGADAVQAEVADITKWYETGKDTLAKLAEKKKWRSTEVSQLAEEGTSVESEVVARQVDVHKLPLEERLTKAAEGKEAGTAAFKAKDWAAARDAYHTGLEYVVKIDYFQEGGSVGGKEVTRDSLEAAKALKLSLGLNAAAACLKCEDWGLAVGYATRALEVEPESAKALYRRGQGLIGTRDFDKAKKDLFRAAKIAPKDKSIRKAYEDAKAKVAEAARPPTEEEEGDNYMAAIEKNEAVYQEFAAMRSDDESQEFIANHPELLNTHATGWMLLKCLELEMAGKSKEMKQVWGAFVKPGDVGGVGYVSSTARPSALLVVLLAGCAAERNARVHHPVVRGAQDGGRCAGGGAAILSVAQIREPEGAGGL